jgi:hypothetical protein
MHGTLIKRGHKMEIAFIILDIAILVTGSALFGKALALKRFNDKYFKN